MPGANFAFAADPCNKVLPPHNRRFREPHGQAAALAQGAVIGGPIRHSVALLRDVMTAILVRFEWHGELSAVRDGPALLQRPPPRRQTTDPCNKAERWASFCCCRQLLNLASPVNNILPI